MSTHVPEYTRILVPLDGSGLSEAALPIAERIARASHAAMLLVRVHDVTFAGEDMGFMPPQWEAEIRESERDYLLRVSQGLASRGDIAVEAELLDGTPGEAISRHAGNVAGTLIVASTSGRTGLSRAWLGSTADWLVRFAPVPVLLVRPSGDAVDAAGRSSSHVLVPLDGSERSARVLPDALRLARVGRARMTLLRVVTPIVRLFGADGISGASSRDEERTMQVMREAKETLDHIASHLRREAAGLQVETEVIASADTATTILECARGVSADAVAMCSRGRGASRLLLGSVADKLLRGFDGVILLLGPVALREMESDSIVEEEEVVVGTK